MAPIEAPPIAFCPICQHGRCRIRVCEGNRLLHGFVVCDECEATWPDPTLQDRFAQKQEQALCPYCGEAVFASIGRWADRIDLCLLGWQGTRLTSFAPH